MSKDNCNWLILNFCASSEVTERLENLQTTLIVFLGSMLPNRNLKFQALTLKFLSLTNSKLWCLTRRHQEVRETGDHQNSLFWVHVISQTLEFPVFDTGNSSLWLSLNPDAWSRVETWRLYDSCVLGLCYPIDIRNSSLWLIFNYFARPEVSERLENLKTIRIVFLGSMSHHRHQ